MEKQVLTQEELQDLKNVRAKRDQLMADFGFLEVQIQELELQKESLIDILTQLKEEEMTLGNNLQSKYGKISVNIDSGEFTVVE